MYELMIETTEIFILGDTLHLSVTYKVFDPASNAEIEGFTLSCPVNNFNEVENSRRDLDDAALSRFATMEGFYETREFGLSIHEISRAVSDWRITPEEQGFKLEHPVSGSFTAALPIDERGMPKLIGRAKAILAVRLLPPTWAEFRSPSTGQIAFRCAAINGASKYAMYANLGGRDYQIVGESISPEKTFNVEARTWNVGVAGVDSKGVVGILSTPSTVAVAATATQISSGWREAPETRAVATKKPKLFQRIFRLKGRG